MSSESVIVVTVVRTGGFAGLKQQWSASVGEADRAEWMPLIDACPWRSVARDETSRDRFVWRIEARVGRARRKASVPDSALTGPWRTLVDRVRGS